MNTRKAKFYDGQTSHSREVEAYFDEAGNLHVVDRHQHQWFALDKLRITPRVGNTPRHIRLDNNATCEIDDNDFIDDALARHRHSGVARAIHGLESRLPYVATAVVFAIVFVAGMFKYGIPLLADHAAQALPTEADQLLGQGTLQAMDKSGLFKPSTLDTDRQAQLTAQFTRMHAGLNDQHPYQLEFRDSPAIGANAFALPSGIVVMTDQLVALAKDDREIEAILAHEIGHVVHRHALRGALQDSAVALVIATLSGDVVSTTILSGAIPATLMHAKYSRGFESQADDYAHAYLRDHHIPLHYFADILARLEATHGGSGQDYLSSHPLTEDRIRQFQTPEQAPGI